MILDRPALVLAALAVVLALLPGRSRATHEVALADLHVDVWTTAKGLPHNLVSDITQSPDGYLWLATWEGVVRYNGHRFDVFDETRIPGLPERGVSEVELDAEGRLLLGLARGGVVRRDAAGWTILPVGGGQGERAIYAFAAQGTELLIGTAGAGVLRHAGTGDALAQPLPGIDQGIVYALQADGPGRWWVGSDRGLDFVDAGRLQRFGTEQGLPPQAVLSLARLGPGKLVVGTERGAFLIEEGRARPLDPGLPEASFEVLLHDRHGNLWLGTAAHGLFRLGEHGLEHLDQAGGLPANRIASLFEDHEGSLWVGSSGGLLRLRQAPFFSLTHARGLVDGYVRSLLDDHDGSLWLATAGGLSRLRGDGGSRSQIDTLLAGESVLSLARGEAGELWIGTYYGGLLRWRDGAVQARYERAEGLPGNQVRALLREADGQVLVGTQRGLVRLAPQDASATPVAGGEDLYVLALHRAADGRLWVGSATGVFSAIDGRLQREEAPALRPVQRVYGFADAADGGLWVASDRGLLHQSAGRWRRIGPEQGLPMASLFSVLVADDGSLWLSSNRGVMRIEREALESALDGGELAGYAVYGEADGMASAQCNGAAGTPALKRADGSLWFATADGATRVRPHDAISRLRKVPAVVVEQVRIDGTEHPVSAMLEVPAGARRLELQFAGLSFQAPGKVHYRYRLEGFDRDWVVSGRERVAQFTNLAPGNYRFRGAAANPNGEWSEHEAVLAIHVLPRWWQRPWLQATLVVSVLGLMWLALRLRLRVLEASQRRLRQQVDRATRDLRERNLELDAFAHTVAHDLKTPLTTLLGLARLLDQAGVALGPEQRSGAIGRIHATARKMAAIIDALLLLSRARTDAALELGAVHNLPLVQEVVASLDELARQHRAQIALPTSIPTVLGYAPWVEQVWVNFLSNAIKYGGEAPQVTVGGEREPGGQVRLWVRDEGPGLDADACERLFRPFARVADVAADGHGLGLSIVRRLVERMDGEVGCDSVPGAGATFWFRLPAAD